MDEVKVLNNGTKKLIVKCGVSVYEIERGEMRFIEMTEWTEMYWEDEKPQKKRSKKNANSSHQKNRD